MNLAATRFGPRGVVYDTQNDKIVVTYCDYGDSSKGKCVVGEVNSTGDSITFGTPVEFHSNDTRYITSVFSPDNNKVVVAFANNNNSDVSHIILVNVMDFHLVGAVVVTQPCIVMLYYGMH